MDNNKKAIIAVGILSLIGGGIWYFTGKPKGVIKNRNYWVKNISFYLTQKGLLADVTAISKYDDSYLQGRSDAIDAIAPTFTYNNAVYSTDTGKVQMTR